LASSNCIIRGFVSSTFKDMEPERNYLQAHTFKDITAYYQQRGWQFQAIDLRWGIPDEAGVDQKTINLCLEEFARCQQFSPRPNFLILLGERYGWCPPPAGIPQQEFETLEPQFSPEGKGLIDAWYALDENALSTSPDGTAGGTYELQPRHGEREAWADHQAWEHVETKLRRVRPCKATRPSRTGHSAGNLDDSCTIKV
jgi:hypothetical protein